MNEYPINLIANFSPYSGSIHGFKGNIFMEISNGLKQNTVVQFNLNTFQTK